MEKEKEKRRRGSLLCLEMPDMDPRLDYDEEREIIHGPGCLRAWTCPFEDNGQEA
jgi:hypothetical protein